MSNTITPSVKAHFTAIANNNAIVDRLRYEMQKVQVRTVAIDTTPAGAPHDTVGIQLSARVGGRF